MDDEKGILVFSDAGGTGRSYHADLAAKISACVSTTFWKPGGAPTWRSKASGAAIAPTRNSRRASG